MATRPVFLPVTNGHPGVAMRSVEFRWEPGLAPTQRRKNVRGLHAALQATQPDLRVLEVSSKSDLALGRRLSAFALGVRSARSGGLIRVESLYQGSKVFADAGPFPECYPLPALDARERLRPWAGQPLTRFELHGVVWPLVPRRAFYDWIYCHALHQNPELADALRGYRAFTDIEFNPARSVNCQAYAVAFYLALDTRGLLAKALSSQTDFLALHPADDAQPPDPTARARKSRATPSRKRPQGGTQPSGKAVARRRPKAERSPQAIPTPLPLFDSAYPAPDLSDPTPTSPDHASPL